MRQQSAASRTHFPQFGNSPSKRGGERGGFRILLTVTFARVVFFPFRALAEFVFPLPFPGEDTDFTQIMIEGVHTCCRLEDASAPQAILCCHTQSVKVSQLTDVQLKMCLLAPACSKRCTPFSLGRERDRRRSPRLVVSPVPVIRSDGHPRPQFWYQTSTS